MSPSGDDSRALIRYALAGTAVTAVVVWTLYLARAALLLVYVSALVAIGLGPLVNAIERRRSLTPWGRRRIPRWLAILAIYLVVISALAAIGSLVLPPLVTQARELWTRLPDLLSRSQRYLVDLGLLGRELTMREVVGSVVARQFEEAPIPGADAFGTVFGAIWGVVGGLFGFLTILILAFYMLVDADNIVTTFVRLFPRNRRSRVADACRRVSTKISAWLAGQLLLGAIIGVTAALGLFLMNVPYFYVLALIAGIGEMIPIVGPILAAIPAIGVALSVSPTLALGVAVFFFVQQQFENHVLVPKIMSRQVGVSAVVVIVALLLGGSLLGVLGAILAVPSAALLQVLFEEVAPDAAER